MFTHLHCHSYFSFNAGTIPATDLPTLAKEAGMTALALSDTNNMSGVIEFYRAAKKAGIKPILGVELKTRHERAVLLAKNHEGYRELCETLTRVLDAIPQTKPKLTLEEDEKAPNKVIEVVRDDTYYPLAPFLTETSENVFLLSSSSSLLKTLAPLRLPNIFIELVPAERKRWKELRDISQNYKLPVVATNNVFLRHEQEYELHKVLRAIGTNTTIGNTPANEIEDRSQSFVNETQYQKLIGNLGEEALRNVERIADECAIEFDTTRAKFARYDTPDPFALLKHYAEAGFKNRYPRPTIEHRTRFEYELAMIERLGATSYFLATHDMIQFAKAKGFQYLGRGSGANSLIAYTLEISNVDPIANNLRFERFLNPERESAPDFDIDFCWDERYEVIHYMLDKYGRDRAAMLCTIQCYRDRGGIREVGKALGFTDAEINEQEMNVRTVRHTSSKSSTSERESSAQSSSLPDIHAWMFWANRLQGFPRHLSVHAGGIVIANEPLSYYTPVQNAPVGVPITHLDMFSAEDLRFIKLDVLSTRGLGTYRDTMDLVQKRYGSRPPIENTTVAFEDERTKDLIRTGKTRGCFYIESPAMIGLLRKLRTDTFENLTAASSVIRPGVAQSGMMQEFIRRHRNPGSFDHIHPLLGELMKETYGVMVYQEDVLNVVHEFARLSYGQADLFRRSMSGKLRSHERMAQMQDTFIVGCVANGIASGVAEEVWRQVSSFGGYSFCKAHSASYATLSFKEAYLKVYYPAEFLCSVLNNFGGFYNHQEYVNEAKALGVTVKLPDVNKSQLRHTVEDERTIRIGLVAFKNVSKESKENVLLNRKSGREYQSIEDFALRSGVTPEDGNILVKLGACDSIAPACSLAGLKFSLLVKRSNAKQGQESFAFPREILHCDLSHLSEPDPLTIFAREKEYFGYSVTNTANDFLSKYSEGATSSTDLLNMVGRTVTVVGFRSASKTVRTKRGELMQMLNVSDAEGMMDIVIWPEQYQKFYTLLSTGSAYRITGKVTESFGVPSLVAQQIETLDLQATAFRIR
jgi:DNA-directed DNA polymerase III PolC